MSTAPDDPGWVGCRICRSLEYRTVRTSPSLEGVYRVHVCAICGERFGSLATYVDKHGDASGNFTRLSDVPLPVQLKP